jgi:acyl-CoA thioester hydrolase
MSAQASEPLGAAHFSYASQVYFDELDPWHMLHNSRYAVHAERANLAWYLEITKGSYGPGADSDQFIFQRHFEIDFSAPLVGPQTMWIDLWMTRFGRTSSTYAFSCRNEDGSAVYARGQRTIVKIDPETRTTSPWSQSLRDAVAAWEAKIGGSATNAQSDDDALTPSA